MGGEGVSGETVHDKVARRLASGRLIAVLRRVPPRRFDLVVDALVAAGVALAEVTWDGPETAELLRRAIATSGEAMTWGMGTVTDPGQVEIARDAGAAYVVSPVLAPEVLLAARDAGLYTVLGAFSATEIWSAWRLGADLVKVFPAAVLGPKYFSELRGPFPDIPLLAVGGVTAENAAAYLEAGADAVAAGGALVRHDLVEAGDRRGLVSAVSRFVRAVKGGSDPAQP